MTAIPFPVRPDHKRLVLVLQGGGALGAFQGGVFEALHEYGFDPDWIGGTSIGAINAALIAGNAPEERVSALQTFWRTVTDDCPWALPVEGATALRRWTSHWSVLGSAVGGRRGFFQPRLGVPFVPFATCGPETASYFETAPLRALLTRLVDFDRINRDGIRVSLGAVNVRTGRPRYFDSREERITPEHVLASGALPPAFPAIRIDGEPYWDGGIYSNTPLEVVLDDYPRVDTLCFAVALFDPAGAEPRTIPEVETRRKDIVYGTRAVEHIEAYRRTHELRRAVRRLYDQLSPEQRALPENRVLAGLGCGTRMDIVPLVYESPAWELAHKDADFTPASVHERWRQGHDSACARLEARSWLAPADPEVAVTVH